MWLAPTGKRLQLWLKGVTGAPEPVGAAKSIQTGASER